MRHDILSDAFSMIKNAESIGRHDCLVPASGLVKSVLGIMKKHGYLGEFSRIEDGRGGKYKIHLLGKINNCNVVRPRFSVKIEDFTKFEKRFLPASDVGVLIISTPDGVTDHKAAKEKKSGGKLLGFVY